MLSVSLYLLFPSFSISFSRNTCLVTSRAIREHTKKMGMSVEIYRVLPPFRLVAGETVPSEDAFGDTSKLDPVAYPALSREFLLEISRGSLQPGRSCESPVAAWLGGKFRMDHWELGLADNTQKSLVFHAFSRILRNCMVWGWIWQSGLFRWWKKAS